MVGKGVLTGKPGLSRALCVVLELRAWGPGSGRVLLTPSPKFREFESE